MENKTVDDILKHYQDNLIDSEAKDIKGNIYSNNVKDIRDLIKPGRRVGNSTRLLNYYIEELFSKRKVYIKDHYDHPKDHKELFHKVLNRLRVEHGLTDCLAISYSNYEIKFIK
jgi:hypothetical protein